MKQYQERNYAPKIRKIEKSDLSKHSHGSAFRQTNEASSGDSLQQSGQEQEEIEVIIKPAVPEAFKKTLEKDIEWFAKVVLLKEPIIFAGDQNEEEMKEYSCVEGHQFNAEDCTHSICGSFACPYCPLSKYMKCIPIKKIIGDQNEAIREEESVKSLEGRQERIQGTDQRRSEAEEGSLVSKKEVKIAKARKAKAKK